MRADAPEQVRMWGVEFGIPGTLQIDVDRGYFHAFASGNVLFPVLTAAGESRWYAGAIGAGLSVPVSPRSHWRVDVLGTVMPLHVTSFYTYLATGIGVGFHHTSASGFTIGFTLPIVGFSTRLGSSPYNYDAPFRYNDSLKYYYFAGFVGMPLLTMGYRFACPC